MCCVALCGRGGVRRTEHRGKQKQKQWEREWENCSRCLCLYNNKYSSFNTSYEIDLNGRICTSSILWLLVRPFASGFGCQITALCTYFIYNVNLIGALTEHIYLAIWDMIVETKWTRRNWRELMEMRIGKRRRRRRRRERENRAQTIQQVLYLEEINSIICAAITALYMLKVLVFTPMKNRVRCFFFSFFRSLFFFYYFFFRLFVGSFPVCFSLFGLVVSAERV